MSLGDKATREKAIPFIASPMKFSETIGNTSDSVEIDRFMFSRPEYGDIVEAYVRFRLTAPASEDVNFKIAVGTASEDASGNPHPTPATPTQSDIDRQHTQITGETGRINVPAGTTQYFEWSILKHLKSQEESPFGIVIILDYGQSHDYNDGFGRDLFNIICSMQMGLT